MTVQPSSSAYATPTALPELSTSSGPTNHIAAIAGGAVAGAVLLALLLLLFIRRRKSRKGRKAATSEVDIQQGHNRINSAEMYAQVQRMRDVPNRRPASTILAPLRPPLVVVTNPRVEDETQSRTTSDDSQSRLLQPTHIPEKSLMLISSSTPATESTPNLGNSNAMVVPAATSSVLLPSWSVEDRLRQLALDSERTRRDAENTRNEAARALAELRGRDSEHSGSIPPEYQS